MEGDRRGRRGSRVLFARRTKLTIISAAAAAMAALGSEMSTMMLSARSTMIRGGSGSSSEWRGAADVSGCDSVTEPSIGAGAVVELDAGVRRTLASLFSDSILQFE